MENARQNNNAIDGFYLSLFSEKREEMKCIESRIISA
jgi:hypothetical protein